MKDNLKALYTGQLVERFFKEFDKRRAYMSTRYQAKAPARRPFTLSGLSELAGVPKQTAKQHVILRSRAMGFQELDRYLWATGISVLDLIQPGEMLSFLQSLDSKNLQSLSRQLKLNLKKGLDNGLALESNRVSDQSGDSQKHPSDQPGSPSTQSTTITPKRGGRKT